MCCLVGLGGSEDAVIDVQLKLLSTRKQGSALSKRVSKKRTVERPDSELARVQRQIISLVGQLDCGTCLTLLEDPHSQDVWGPCLQQQLHFSLPFKDMKLKIRLGKYPHAFWVRFLLGSNIFISTSVLGIGADIYDL